jgi:tetratricopeptide (TPR) repeat protein
MKGDGDRAVQNYDQAIHVNPDYYGAYSARGHLHGARKEFELAVQDYTECIRLAPESAAGFNDRASTYSQMGKSNLAIADEDQAIRVAPNDATGWNNRCWDRAIVGKLSEAREDCEHALVLDPNYVAALDSLGFVYLKMKNPQQAIANYNAALVQEPKTPTSLYGRGLAEIQKGDPNADADLAAAKAIQPDIADDFAKWGVPPPSKPINNKQ